MAGYVYRDQNGSSFMECSVTYNTKYPPSLIINVYPWTTSGPDRKNGLFVPLDIKDLNLLAMNLKNPASYGPVKGRTKNNSSIGRNGDTLVISANNSMHTLNMNPMDFENFAQYLTYTSVAAGPFKDLLEAIVGRICMMAKQVGVNISPYIMDDQQKNNNNRQNNYQQAPQQRQQPQQTPQFQPNQFQQAPQPFQQMPQPQQFQQAPQPNQFQQTPQPSQFNPQQPQQFQQQAPQQNFLSNSVQMPASGASESEIADLVNGLLGSQ